MRFSGTIIAYHDYHTDPSQMTKAVTVFNERFESTNIVSAKSKLSRIANNKEIIVIENDEEQCTFEGKELHWDSWTPSEPFIRNDKQYMRSKKDSEIILREHIEYKVIITLYWIPEEEATE